MSAASPAISTTSALTWADHWGHIQARWGYRRNEHLVAPGLYALGRPGPDSPVFVTANYTLSFDALRRSLPGRDGYLLVLDTRGVNVWCAAGKGSFGTEELVARIEAVGLGEVVSHRTLILPQLGATGVSAHEVKRRSGFTVKYGPVRASDLPEYLNTGRATTEMRRVRFDLWDRAVLIPVELVSILPALIVAAAVLYLPAGALGALGIAAAPLAGVVLFPLLLPWLPTPYFSTKGLILGGVTALVFGWAVYAAYPQAAGWFRAAWVLVFVLAMAPVTAYIALNFTGSSTYTSKTGVRTEMFTYVPVMAILLGAGVVLAVALTVYRIVGGS